MFLKEDLKSSSFNPLEDHVVCGLPTSLFFTFLVEVELRTKTRRSTKNLNVLFYDEQEKSERSAIDVEEVLN